jgi:hypothetical protein
MNLLLLLLNERMIVVLCGLLFIATAEKEPSTMDGLAPHGVPAQIQACRVPAPAPGPALPRPVSDFMVSANANFQWVVNGVVNPVLTLTRGQTYTFDLTTVTDEHPFVINADPVYPFAPFLVPSSYGQVITFTPDLAMPATLHYHCTVHYGSMSGVIQLIAPTPCRGDLNNDNVVNTTDFTIFVGAFNTTCMGCPADLNSDGLVSTTDFSIFVGLFGRVCTP